ncbi:hypothetical protein [Microbacterium sp. NPDC087868]|uniref:hypothetical protein n=1 Tax=Microbacterium sp. NPDC087868 TaxID=3364195 RepID=UPI00384C5313
MADEKDLEIEAMGTVSKALAGIDEDARGRVIRWVAERYGISVSTAKSRGAVNDQVDQDDEDGEDDAEIETGGGGGYSHFAELYDASGASTHGDGMLVAAYWVQILRGQESFGSLELNKLLKDLGHGVTGTAKVMTNLIGKKPALILQLKKSGKSKQARKTYKLTDAGRKAVEQMIVSDAS